MDQNVYKCTLICLYRTQYYQIDRSLSDLKSILAIKNSIHSLHFSHTRSNQRRWISYVLVLETMGSVFSVDYLVLLYCIKFQFTERRVNISQAIHKSIEMQSPFFCISLPEVILIPLPDYRR